MSKNEKLHLKSKSMNPKLLDLGSHLLNNLPICLLNRKKTYNLEKIKLGDHPNFLKYLNSVFYNPELYFETLCNNKPVIIGKQTNTSKKKSSNKFLIPIPVRMKKSQKKANKFVHKRSSFSGISDKSQSNSKVSSKLERRNAKVSEPLLGPGQSYVTDNELDDLFIKYKTVIDINKNKAKDFITINEIDLNSYPLKKFITASENIEKVISSDSPILREKSLNIKDKKINNKNLNFNNHTQTSNKKIKQKNIIGISKYSDTFYYNKTNNNLLSSKQMQYLSGIKTDTAKNEMKKQLISQEKALINKKIKMLSVNKEISYLSKKINKSKENLLLHSSEGFIEKKESQDKLNDELNLVCPFMNYEWSEDLRKYKCNNYSRKRFSKTEIISPDTSKEKNCFVRNPNFNGYFSPIKYFKLGKDNYNYLTKKLTRNHVKSFFEKYENASNNLKDLVINGKNLLVEEFKQTKNFKGKKIINNYDYLKNELVCDKLFATNTDFNKFSKNNFENM